MRVVISGYYGFDNVGDEAILLSIIQALRTLNPSISITVLSNNLNQTESLYSVKAVNRWNVNAVAQAINSSDGLISGGGSLLQDETGWKSIPYYAGIMKIAQFLGKPVFVYAQGMGPFKMGFNKWIVRQVIQKTKVITVRDKESKSLLESIGVKKPITIAPDPVIGLNTSQNRSDFLENQGISGSVLTVAIREWPSPIDYKTKIAKALDQCVQKGINVIFVPMHGKNDNETSEEIASLMKQSSLIAPHDAPIEEKISVIGDSDLLFGMRLHSLIFAAITNTPFISLSYDPKIDAFTSLCGQPLIGNMVEDNWDETTITSKIESIMESIEKEKKRLGTIVQPLKESALETANFVIESFK
jgi:polysaccharide pyruvyl transferase CsaB